MLPVEGKYIFANGTSLSNEAPSEAAQATPMQAVVSGNSVGERIRRREQEGLEQIVSALKVLKLDGFVEIQNSVIDAHQKVYRYCANDSMSYRQREDRARNFNSLSWVVFLIIQKTWETNNTQLSHAYSQVFNTRKSAQDSKFKAGGNKSEVLRKIDAFGDICRSAGVPLDVDRLKGVIEKDFEHIDQTPASTTRRSTSYSNVRLEQANPSDTAHFLPVQPMSTRAMVQQNMPELEGIIYRFLVESNHPFFNTEVFSCTMEHMLIMPIKDLQWLLFKSHYMSCATSKEAYLNKFFDNLDTLQRFVSSKKTAQYHTTIIDINLMFETILKFFLCAEYDDRRPDAHGRPTFGLPPVFRGARLMTRTGTANVKILGEVKYNHVNQSGAKAQHGKSSARSANWQLKQIKEKYVVVSMPRLVKNLGKVNQDYTDGPSDVAFMLAANHILVREQSWKQSWTQYDHLLEKNDPITEHEELVQKPGEWYTRPSFKTCGLRMTYFNLKIFRHYDMGGTSRQFYWNFDEMTFVDADVADYAFDHSSEAQPSGSPEKRKRGKEEGTECILMTIAQARFDLLLDVKKTISRIRGQYENGIFVHSGLDVDAETSIALRMLFRASKERARYELTNQSSRVRKAEESPQGKKSARAI